MVRAVVLVVLLVVVLVVVLVSLVVEVIIERFDFVKDTRQPPQPIRCRTFHQERNDHEHQEQEFRSHIVSDCSVNGLRVSVDAGAIVRGLSNRKAQ
jgi:hypothetical protein